MPLIGVELGFGASGDNVRVLHDQLNAWGAVIAAEDYNGKKFGESTAVAVRDYNRVNGLPGGDKVDGSTARLLYTASVLHGTGDRQELGKAVREAVAAGVGGATGEVYGLARYAVIAGDYKTANKLARTIPDHEGVKNLIAPILALPNVVALPDPNQPPAAPPPRPPEVPYPENFYTYRRQWVDPDALKRVIDDWHTLGEGNLLTPEIRAAGPHALAALGHWQEGNEHFDKRRYAAAVAEYDACQDSVIEYFVKFFSNQNLPNKINLPANLRTWRLMLLYGQLSNQRATRTELFGFFQRRRELLALSELEELDRLNPEPAGAFYGALQFGLWMGRPEADGTLAQTRRNLDAPLALLAYVMAPMARSEANRARRKLEAAVLDQLWLSFMTPFTCAFIEQPFINLLHAETMLEKGDAEYKARTLADSPSAWADYQGLKAAETYSKLKKQLQGEAEYVAKVDASRDALAKKIRDRVADGDVRSKEYKILGKEIHFPDLSSSSVTLPGMDRRARAHEPLLKVTPAGGQPAVRETNPRMYAVLLTATARLEQLGAKFNYLGYLDSYVPPWRFQFLLDRARHFAEHARNAQRDYLNFLGNAEREELQEQSAAQNVELEKTNVHIETARVDQVQLELAAAQWSSDLATLHAKNAAASFEDYKRFEQVAEDAETLSNLSSIGDSILSLATGGGGRIYDALIGEPARAQASAAQRFLERKNLERASVEAVNSAFIAAYNRDTAEAALTVAGLQRQAALLRHEHALQNLNFLRNRVLNAEQWQRLALAVRSVGETYLRYAVEVAFLAEQAYEFEANKSVNVIRFDYDLSDVGDFLASDFLLRDLDTLEQDLIITQRQRQQHVRYVLSMAREFPSALQDLRDSGKTSFSLRLEQLEKRLPGLYNIRIGAVDVTPLALADSTRFNLQLTYLGASQVRLKEQPDTPVGVPSPSPLNKGNIEVGPGGWLPELQETWPVKIRVNGPETAVFSGLSRQDAAAVFMFTSAGQRNAFEGLGAAAAWEVDLSSRDNRVVPGTLSDLLITFTLSGYYDDGLREAVENVTRPDVLTKWLSARQAFPDAFYAFNRSGKMDWRVTEDLLTVNESVRRLRNIGMTLVPATSRVQFGRLACHRRVVFQVRGDGSITRQNIVPRVTYSLPYGQPGPALELGVKAEFVDDADVSWDFGDGSERVQQPGAGAQWIRHPYARPGRYEVTLRLVRGGRLSEYKSDVIVSGDDEELEPLVATPTLEGSIGEGGKIHVLAKAGALPHEKITAVWRIERVQTANKREQMTKRGEEVSFVLEPGKDIYILDLVAVRTLNVRVHNKQLRTADNLLSMQALGLSTNRQFNADGEVISGTDPTSPLTTHLFPNNEAISPVDDWGLELKLEDNPCLRGVGHTGAALLDLGGVQDAILALEYEVDMDSSPFF